MVPKQMNFDESGYVKSNMVTKQMNFDESG